MDIFFLDILADIEASGHGAFVAFLMNDLALLILAFFFEALGSGNRQVAILQLQIDLILFEARQVHL